MATSTLTSNKARTKTEKELSFLGVVVSHHAKWQYENDRKKQKTIENFFAKAKNWITHSGEGARSVDQFRQTRSRGEEQVLKSEIDWNILDSARVMRNLVLRLRKDSDWSQKAPPPSIHLPYVDFARTQAACVIIAATVPVYEQLWSRGEEQTYENSDYIC